MEVLSTDHSSGIRGKYFNFERTVIPRLQAGKEMRFTASNSRTGQIGEVKVWGIASGGGTAHGRFVENPSADQWKKGDGVIIYMDSDTDLMVKG